MSLYHLHAQVIGRAGGKSARGAGHYRAGTRSGPVARPSKPRSAVGAAAYRDGQKYRALVDGEWHDYSRKNGVLGHEMLLPEGAPEWMNDSERLFRSIDAKEKRDDAQLVREVEVSGQRELSFEQNRAAVLGFVQEQFVSKGMVAHISWHDKGDGNPHAHILLSLREMKREVRHASELTSPKRQVLAGSPDTAYWGNKNREWNDYHRFDRHKNGSIPRTLIYQWRERWADHVNSALQKAGKKERIDHRSLYDQGSSRAPTKHRGKEATGMMRRFLPTRREAARAEIDRTNRQRRHTEKAAQSLAPYRPVKSPARWKPEKGATWGRSREGIRQAVSQRAEVKGVDYGRKDIQYHQARAELERGMKLELARIRHVARLAAEGAARPHSERVLSQLDRAVTRGAGDHKPAPERTR